ncbi:MAG: hypothetical protein NTZ33_03230 [Bacteroidetes bacterium]|nr:hypothetical protein [Bacteroidota bacterium]
MKTKILFILIFLSVNVFAQKVNEEQVPKDVLIGLETAYPEVKAKSWEIKDGNYLANVKVDGQSGIAEFTPDGKWVVTKFPVGEKELPSTVVKFFYDNYAPEYKINVSQIIEEPNDISYYYLKIQKKGIGQEQNGELFFDLTGKLTKNTAPEPVAKAKPAEKTAKKDDVFEEDDKPVKSKKKKEVVEEDDIPAPKAEKAEKPVKTAKSSRVSAKAESKPEPRVAKTSKVAKKTAEDEEASSSSSGTPMIVKKYFDKKFPRSEKVEWTQLDSNYVASFIFHEMEQRAEFAPDGKLVGTTSIMDPKNIFKPLENYLTKKFDRYKVIKAEKVVYERTYQKMFPDKKLKNYYYVEISQKVKGSKIPKISKLWFDGVGQIDRVEEGDVEDEAPVKEKRSKHDKGFEDKAGD